MSHSNSSLNTFANCMKKYEHTYVLHTPPCKPASPHLAFGSMAHEVLEKAGRLRDDVSDGIVRDEEYDTVIPSEVVANDLKDTFGIKTWHGYFTGVIKQVAEYEASLVQEFKDWFRVESEIHRELKLQLTVEDMIEKHQVYGLKQPFVGVIDLLLMAPGHGAIIMDYKFSTGRKNQNDFDMNSQLPLYAMMVHDLYDVPLCNIQYGYIDIPKQDFESPTLLTNGTLSRAKNQNVTQEMYGRAVLAIHGDDPYYNVAPGGYYYDAWCNMANNKAAYMSKQWIDESAYEHIIQDLFNAAKMIDRMTADKMPFLTKYDSYSCASCDYVNSCKPWTTMGGE